MHSYSEISPVYFFKQPFLLKHEIIMISTRSRLLNIILVNISTFYHTPHSPPNFSQSLHYLQTKRIHHILQMFRNKIPLRYTVKISEISPQCCNKLEQTSLVCCLFEGLTANDGLRKTIQALKDAP